MDCACLHREAVALHSPDIGGTRAALGNKQKHEAVRRRRYTPQPRVAAFRGAPWVTDDNTHGYPEGQRCEAFFVVSSPETGGLS